MPALTPHPRTLRPACGFTLIELMVVIVIIAILMAIILPTIGFVRERNKRVSTTALIKALDTALQQYYQNFEEYPPSTVDDLGDPGSPMKDSLYRFLCGEDGKGVVQKIGTRERRFDPMPISKEFLVKEGDGYIVVDAWRQPLIFKNCKAYTNKLSAQAKSKLDDDGTCMNPDSFDLFSTGGDRKRDPDPKKVIDDITNWTVVRQQDNRK